MATTATTRTLTTRSGCSCVRVDGVLRGDTHDEIEFEFVADHVAGCGR